MALMLLAAEWSRVNHRPSPSAVTVDHGLRAGSGAEALQVAKWANALSIPHTILTRKGQRLSQNIQAQARDVRYRLLGEWMTKQKIGTILTGHTMNDQAETFLMRLARGSGLDGLSCMAPNAHFPLPEFYALRLTRPLLAFTHERLVEYLRERGQPWIEDPSNTNDRFSRVRMRAALPILADLGITSQQIAETTARLRSAREVIETKTKCHLNETVQLSIWGYALVSDKFMSAPDEVLVRCLSQLIARVGGSPYAPRFEQTLSILQWLKAGKSHPAGRTLGGCRLENCKPNRVLITREEAALTLDSPVLNLRQGESGLWDNRFEIELPGDAGLGVFAVKALGTVGLKALGKRADLPKIQPRRISVAQPSIWKGDRLMSVPSLNFHKEFKASAKFIGMRPR